MTRNTFLGTSSTNINAIFGFYAQFYTWVPIFVVLAHYLRLTKNEYFLTTFEISQNSRSGPCKLVPRGREAKIWVREHFPDTATWLRGPWAHFEKFTVSKSFQPWRNLEPKTNVFSGDEHLSSWRANIFIFIYLDSGCIKVPTYQFLAS